MKILITTAAFLFCICVGFLLWHDSAPHDIWWQMANGRLITESGSLVTEDPFTFTVEGSPYLNKYWLYEILTFKIFSLTGWTGLVILRAILIIGALISIYLCIGKKPVWLLMMLLVPALIIIDLRISLRAYWFTLLILPVFIRYCIKLFANEDFSCKNIGALLLLQVAWTNLHGEFFWGCLAAAIYFADYARKQIIARKSHSNLLRPSLYLLLIFAATLINPFGYKLVPGLISEATLVGTNTASTEWMPYVAVARPLNIIALLTLIVITTVTLIRAGKNISIPLAILFVYFALLSQYSLRFLGAFAFISCLTAMEHGPYLKTSERMTGRLTEAAACFAITGLLAIITSLCMGYFYYWQAENKYFGSGLIEEQFPVKTSEFLKNHSIKGNFINSWSHGGYLIWNNWPDIRIAEDGRTSPFPPELSAQIRAIADGSEKDLDEFSSKYHVDGAIVRREYTGLIIMLVRKAGWEPLFIGPNSSVWMTDDTIKKQNLQHLVLDIDKMERVKF
ncbi:hypothetical protein BVX97_03445 [bacterium E08(2017)]|nr:hypothetical protein BVX97_03445 [bacterium E08(2017)]